MIKINDLSTMKKLNPFLVVALLLYACQSKETFDPQKVVDHSIDAHGLRLLEKVPVTFNFRERTYGIQRSPRGNTYTRSFTADSVAIEDLMSADGLFERRADGRVVKVADSMAFKYKESINSVAYFFQLPLPLNDVAVNKKAIEIVEIDDKAYYSIGVTFKQQGGGTDYEDEFRYWIGKDDHLLDFLAYNYQTNGGGVRFRKAVNRREVQGLIVQDYINYRPEDKAAPLDSLPSMFEQGKLIEVSRIEKTKIRIGAIKKP